MQSMVQAVHGRARIGKVKPVEALRRRMQRSVRMTATAGRWCLVSWSQ
jgi:hypothetical protein